MVEGILERLMVSLILEDSKLAPYVALRSLDDDLLLLSSVDENDKPLVKRR